MTLFSGLCQNGPKNGKILRHNAPIVRVPLPPDISINAFKDDITPLSTRAPKIGQYVWNYRLKEWKWEWPE